MPKSGQQRVELIDHSTKYQGFFRLDSYRLRHLKHAGGWTPVIERELFERGHAAALLPYDPLRDLVILIEQFRIGAYAAGFNPWLVEIVAGIIEADEDAETVVRRECKEEAGCEVETLEPIGCYLMSPGGTSESISFFCGRVDARGAGGLYGRDDEVEDIKAYVLPASDAIAGVAEGRIRNATAVIALQWLALNRERLKSEWTEAQK